MWIELSKRGIIDVKLSRKAIHTTSAPLFMLFWPLYSSSNYAGLIAALVPAVQLLRLWSAGITNKQTGSSSDAGLVGAISRSGNKAEALGGPLIYTAVLLLVTLAFFKSSPVGIVTLSQMAIGDGLADIVGRKWGSAKWPFSSSKSYVGTLAFALGAFVVSTALSAYYVSTGCFDLDVVAAIPVFLVISIVCALVELIPPGYVDDNISVPFVAMTLSLLLLHLR